MKKDRDLWKCSGEEKDPVYHDGEHGGSELAAVIQDYFEGQAEKIEKLNSSQLDHLERVLADCLSFVKRTYCGRFFEIRRADWPRAFWSKEERLRGFARCLYSRWWDHGESWRHMDSNNVYHVSHPYNFNTDQLQHLIDLEKAGFEVEISGNSHYNPGKTICVRVRKNPTNHGVA